MKLIKYQIAGASTSDSLANLSVIGIFQTVEDAVTELLGRLNADNITMKNMDNVIWVFVKNRIRILKNIVWNQVPPGMGIRSRLYGYVKPHFDTIRSLKKCVKRLK